MGIIKFNRKQLKNPTPAGVAFKINLIIAISSVVGVWMGTANFIPAKVSTLLQSFLSLVVGVCVAIKPFFGVESTTTSVPVDDVKEMEVPNETKTS